MPPRRSGAPPSSSPGDPFSAFPSEPALYSGFLPRGTEVIVRELQNQPHLNGLFGVIDDYLPGKDRYRVELRLATNDEDFKQLRPANLRIPDPRILDELISVVERLLDRNGDLTLRGRPMALVFAQELTLLAGLGEELGALPEPAKNNSSEDSSGRTTEGGKFLPTTPAPTANTDQTLRIERLVEKATNRVVGLPQRSPPTVGGERCGSPTTDRSVSPFPQSDDRSVSSVLPTAGSAHHRAELHRRKAQAKPGTVDMCSVYFDEGVLLQSMGDHAEALAAFEMCLADLELVFSTAGIGKNLKNDERGLLMELGRRAGQEDSGAPDAVGRELLQLLGMRPRVLNKIGNVQLHVDVLRWEAAWESEQGGRSDVAREGGGTAAVGGSSAARSGGERERDDSVSSTGDCSALPAVVQKRFVEYTSVKTLQAALALVRESERKERLHIQAMWLEERRCLMAERRRGKEAGAPRTAAAGPKTVLGTPPHDPPIEAHPAAFGVSTSLFPPGTGGEASSSSSESGEHLDLDSEDFHRFYRAIAQTSLFFRDPTKPNLKLDLARALWCQAIAASGHVKPNDSRVTADVLSKEQTQKIRNLLREGLSDAEAMLQLERGDPGGAGGTRPLLPLSRSMLQDIVVSGHHNLVLYFQHPPSIRWFLRRKKAGYAAGSGWKNVVPSGKKDSGVSANPYSPEALLGGGTGVVGEEEEEGVAAALAVPSRGDGEDDSDEEEVCPICLEALKVPEEGRPVPFEERVFVTLCGHIFHDSCQLKTGSRGCPVCRQPVMPLWCYR